MGVINTAGSPNVAMDTGRNSILIAGLRNIFSNIYAEAMNTYVKRSEGIDSPGRRNEVSQKANMVYTYVRTSHFILYAYASKVFFRNVMW